MLENLGIRRGAGTRPLLVYPAPGTEYVLIGCVPPIDRESGGGDLGPPCASIVPSPEMSPLSPEQVFTADGHLSIFPMPGSRRATFLQSLWLIPRGHTDNNSLTQCLLLLFNKYLLSYGVLPAWSPGIP